MMNAAGQRMLKYVYDGNAGKPLAEELFCIRREPELPELQHINKTAALRMTWTTTAVKGILEAETASDSDSDLELIASVNALKPHFAGGGFISQQAKRLRSIETGILLKAKA